MSHVCTNPNASDSSEEERNNTIACPVVRVPISICRCPARKRCVTPPPMRCPAKRRSRSRSRPPQPRCKHGFCARLRDLLCEFFGFGDGQFPGNRTRSLFMVLLGIAILIYYGISFNSKMGEMKQDVNILKYYMDCVTGSLDESGGGMCTRDMALSQLEREQKALKGKAHSRESELQSMIQKQLETYDADKNGLIDYALESAGGSIIDTPKTSVYVIEKPTFWLFGLAACRKVLAPSMVIQASNLPGECWPFEGSKGTIVIQLLGNVMITGFSVEHIPKYLSPTGETSSAPKEFSFRGLEDAYDKNGFEFGRYKYDNSGSRLQYFEAKHMNNKAYSIVQFKVYSNHGNPDFTCIYRVRVHGSLAKQTN